MGRATAFAYAREGADVVINYHPDEEPDAQEVIKVIKDAGPNSVALQPEARVSSRLSRAAHACGYHH